MAERPTPPTDDAKTASDTLRELSAKVLDGKAGRQEIATVLTEAAERLDAREDAYLKLREGFAQQAWTSLFGSAIAGYLADPLVTVDTQEMRDRMLVNCHEIAETALVHWRHRWAGGPPPARLERTRRPRKAPTAKGAVEGLEKPETVGEHVAGALKVFDDQDKTAKASREQTRRAKNPIPAPLPERPKPKAAPEAEPPAQSTPDPNRKREPGED